MEQKVDYRRPNSLETISSPGTRHWLYALESYNNWTFGRCVSDPRCVSCGRTTDQRLCYECRKKFTQVEQDIPHRSM